MIFENLFFYFSILNHPIMFWCKFEPPTGSARHFSSRFWKFWIFLNIFGWFLGALLCRKWAKFGDFCIFPQFGEARSSRPIEFFFRFDFFCKYFPRSVDCAMFRLSIWRLGGRLGSMKIRKIEIFASEHS